MAKHVLYRSDLSDYALKELKLWDALTADQPHADEVEVEVVRVESWRRPKLLKNKFMRAPRKPRRDGFTGGVHP